MLNYLKYEWLRKWKFFLAGILIFLVANLDLIYRISIKKSPNFLSVILIVLFWVLAAALVLDHIGRLYRSLFTDEGLFDLTLPQSGYKFLAVRLLGVLLESILVIAILGIAVYIDVLYLTEWRLADLAAGAARDYLMGGLQLVALMLMLYLVLILMIYLSLTLSKSVFAAIKYSKVIYFLSFLFIAKGMERLIYLLSVKTHFLGFGFIMPYVQNGYGPYFEISYANFMVIGLIIVLLFAGTACLLDRKINL